MQLNLDLGPSEKERIIQENRDLNTKYVARWVKENASQFIYLEGDKYFDQDAGCEITHKRYILRAELTPDGKVFWININGMKIGLENWSFPIATAISASDFQRTLSEQWSLFFTYCKKMMGKSFDNAANSNDKAPPLRYRMKDDSF